MLPDLAAVARSLGFRYPDAGLACVTGFGSAAWDRLFGGERPAHLHPFPELRGRLHHAPATPGDVLLHIRAERMDVCYEWAAQLLTKLGGALRIVDETHGFRYLTTGTCSVSWTVRRTRWATTPARRRSSARRTRSSRAAAMSSYRSTCTT
ncbi:hypothetical protein SMICM304S_05974 [Streptomyces microflavus]